MKAIQMMQTGTPDVLRFNDIDEPAITSDSQIKVKLSAAGINPIDTKIRSHGPFFPDALPTVLGCDGAGTVEEVGAAVTRFKAGDEVWFCNGGLGREQGNYAEYTVVEEAVARAKPKKFSFIESAAAPLVLITAWESLFDKANLNKQQTVLIHAGAGGVGHVAIQLAKLAGATVVTTVGSNEKADFVTSLGADEVILYKETDFVEKVNQFTHGQGVDVLLDPLGGKSLFQSVPAVKHYGNLVTLLDPGTEVEWNEIRNRNLRICFQRMLTPMMRDLPLARAHQGEILDQCAEWIDEGKLTIQAEQTMPLQDAAKAHNLIEEGHMRGKLVLVMDS